MMATKSESLDTQFFFHVGNYLRDIIKTQGKEQTVLSEELGITPVGLQKRLEKPHYGTIEDIKEISKMLNIDIFKELSDKFNEEVRIGTWISEEEHEEKIKELHQLNLKYRKLERDNERYIDEISTLNYSLKVAHQVIDKNGFLKDA